MVEAQGLEVGEEEYSKKLIMETNDKKYSERNLRNMRQFYLTFKDEI